MIFLRGARQVEANPQHNHTLSVYLHWTLWMFTFAESNFCNWGKRLTSGGTLPFVLRISLSTDADSCSLETPNGWRHSLEHGSHKGAWSALSKNLYGIGKELPAGPSF